MKCPTCGSNCPDNAVFCTSCGTALPRGDRPAQQPQQPAEQRSNEEVPLTAERLRAALNGNSPEDAAIREQALRLLAKERARKAQEQAAQGTPAAQDQTAGQQSAGYPRGPAQPQANRMPYQQRPGQGQAQPNPGAYQRPAQNNGAVRRPAQPQPLQPTQPVPVRSSPAQYPVRQDPSAGAYAYGAGQQAQQTGNQYRQAYGQQAAPAGGYNTGSYPAVGYPSAALMDQWKVNRAGSSSLFLVAAIFLSISLAISIFSPNIITVLLSILSGTPVTGILGTILDQTGLAGELNELVGVAGLDKLTTALRATSAWSGGLMVLVKIAVNLVPALVLTGVWIIYATSRKGTRTVPGGITLIQVIKVIICILSVLSTLGFGSFMLIEGLNSPYEELKKPLLIGAAVLYVLTVLVIVYYVYVIKPMGIARHDVYAENGSTVPGFSVFVVMATGILQILFAFFSVPRILEGISTILFAVVLMNYRKS